MENRTKPECANCTKREKCSHRGKVCTEWKADIAEIRRENRGE